MVVTCFTREVGVGAFIFILGFESVFMVESIADGWPTGTLDGAVVCPHCDSARLVSMGISASPQRHPGKSG